jgi:hypothetical protein
MSKIHISFIAFLLVYSAGGAADNALSIQDHSPPSRDYIEQYVIEKPLSDGQLLSFILDENLDEYKSILSSEDYNVLIKESKTQEQFRRDNLIATTKIMLKAVETFIGDQDITTLDVVEYASNMAPVLQKVSDMTMLLHQRRLQRTLAKLSVSGQHLLTNVVLSSDNLHGRDFQIKWQDLADNDPVKFRDMHIEWLTYLQGFGSANDIDVVYKESAAEFTGDGIKTDRVASQANSYQIVKKKGIKK